MAPAAREWPELAARGGTWPGDHPQDRAMNILHDNRNLLEHAKAHSKSIATPVRDHLTHVGAFLAELLKHPPGADWWASHEALHREVRDLRANMNQHFKTLEISTKGLPSITSWAAAARKAPPPTSASISHATNSTEPASPPELRDADKVIVKLGSPAMVKRYRGYKPERILHDTEQARRRLAMAEGSLPLAGVKFCAARQLMSGDLSLTLRSAAEAEVARRHPAWAKALDRDAVIRRPTYGVVVHGVPRGSADLAHDQEVIIDRLVTQNSHCWGEKAEIDRVNWLAGEPTRTRGRATGLR
ncbi:uncharacterized protein BO97DRAFT_231204 [Aspergillus homomorphus CBS 101889]|uniref:Uncharacterized protein n=1 Tax=Aspergillus homomorphus (strain CBS 101889) TaxID=1450537 RepID=A0A395HJZ6_ASPHC|nr:hypothetical protein BO97DRAFT_231204 [Aspergillus homomorphus CBS 101889]RAL07839.1 hypothetical protein BO97DRAFT_231204 [Aspergillus homomorphus CBS 101889]